MPCFLTMTVLVEVSVLLCDSTCGWGKREHALSSSCSFGSVLWIVVNGAAINLR